MPDRTAPRRTIVITGAAAGIGWATARRFAAEGDRVAILDRDAPAAAARAAELGGDHFALPVDVGDEAALVDAIGVAHARLGRLDVLINNAATIYSGGGQTLDLELAAYRRLMAVNVSGARVAARRAAAVMRAQGEGGAIVNVASLAGVVAVPNRTAYSVSKAAMIGLTRALAVELASSDIRVNAVLPGFTATETYRASQRTRTVDSTKVERRIPLGRLAEPDEIAAAIRHLASPDARLTMGTLLPVDGGFHSYGGIDDASAGGVARPEPRSGPRVALVAGAGTAVGAALAARFAACGTQMILLDRVSDALIDRSGADRAVRAALSRFGRIDLLVNASHDPSPAPFGSMLDDGLTKALILAQATAPIMIKQGTGAIVNLCAARGSPGAEGYDGQWAAQAGMMMLTRSLACEWARHGIRVNAVVPCESSGAAAGIAGAIDFLGSDEASYITGVTYSTNGGEP